MILPSRVRLIAITLVSTAALVCRAEAPIRPPTWADDFLSRWYTLYNSGDAAGLARMFSPDARFGEDHGRRAIEASMAADFIKTQYHCAGNYDGVQVLGDLAVAWGHESCLETSKADRTSIRTHERWLLVFRKQPDGSWLLSEETFSAQEAGDTP